MESFYFHLWVIVKFVIYFKTINLWQATVKIIRYVGTRKGRGKTRIELVLSVRVSKTNMILQIEQCFCLELHKRSRRLKKERTVGLQIKIKQQTVDNTFQHGQIKQCLFNIRGIQMVQHSINTVTGKRNKKRSQSTSNARDSVNATRIQLIFNLVPVR